ncbi:SUKH-3 domain-containing protein [Lysinibacillus sp. fls2-241-R2A-57]|uniref:SUKH-3 domain-containing protein n=1 Tax=Lysinibacillus sp. fls2-241-R2A-57 TaxID=3040292 RepID=UPI002554B278|nr:SUKH-3 domain-containing protein [Lysinibacillus sp. fls2-241-R2A-57]
MEEKVLALLQKAGWFKGRKVDISKYIASLINGEYIIFNRAADFLKEYGDLIIQFENPKRSDSYFTLTINPIEAASSIFREVSKSYEKYCAESFVIIGEIPTMEMTWYISSSGKFYGGYDDSLISLGDDFYHALYNIVSGAELEVILVEEG